MKYQQRLKLDSKGETMKRICLVIMVCLLLMLCSCEKEASNIQQTTDATNPSFIEEKVSDNFTYEIYDTYIKITGYKGMEHIVTVPKTINEKPVTILGEYSFYQQTEMTEIHLPSGIETIEEGAFYRCYALTSITIPKTVTQIGTDAFFRCSSLQNIIVDTDNSTYCDIDGILFCKDKTELIAYPEGKTETRYIIPNSVTKIKGNVFGYKTNLKIIGIPSNVTELPDYNIFVYPDEIMLLVSPDSTAEAYAQKQKIKYTIETNI